jgi:F0F1-type ATP synthase membrane subunit c/vacuolar-type H+-ATPase subunit K
MGQGGKQGGKPSGKPSGKQGKPSGKQGKPSGKQGKPSGKQGSEQKNQKKGSNKSYSMVSLCLCVCLSIVYSLMIGYLGGAAIKTVGDNPQLLQMAAMGSDTRLKKNVKNVNYGLKELTQLQPKSYNYVYEQDSTTRHLGVMAQDLKQIMPELVVEIDPRKTEQFRNTLPENIRDETLYGVKYQELVPVLINAIKELKEEVDTLKQFRH